MKNLLELVQEYQTGGYVNPFDASGQPTIGGVLSDSDIELTDDKYQAFLPTYDQTGEQFTVDNYMLGREGMYSGAQDALSTAGEQQRQFEATSGFAGSGTNLLDSTRSDIVSQFGQEGQRMRLGLEQDIYGQRRGFEDQLLSAIGDLPDDAYTIGETDNTIDTLPTTDQGDVTYNGQLFIWSDADNAYLPSDGSGGTTTLGFSESGDVPGGNNPDNNAPWSQPGYDPSSYGSGSTYTDTNGKVYIFNPADNSWLWDGMS
tara:strand:+ start:4417 stop:5193 length:777 start_codon:yes stop_codon:yes gene_type:complete